MGEAVDSTGGGAASKNAGLTKSLSKTSLRSNQSREGKSPLRTDRASVH